MIKACNCSVFKGLANLQDLQVKKMVLKENFKTKLMFSDFNSSSGLHGG
jgi:hypothetical protein